MTTRSLPDAAQARLEQARVAAELEFLNPPPYEPPPRDGGDIVVLDWRSSDELTIGFVLTMADAVIGTVCDVAVQEQWSAETLHAETETRLEQLMADAYAQKHSKGATFAEVSTWMWERLRSRPGWIKYLKTLQARSLPAPVTVAAQLQALLVETGWTIDELAAHVKLDRSNVLDHKDGKSVPRPANRKKYEEVFSAKLKRPIKLVG